MKYYESVYVFLPLLSGMQSACAVLYCQLWSVRQYRIFPRHLKNGTIFGGKKIWNICFDFLNKYCLKHFSLTIQNYQRDALNIIYSSNIITFRYMFRVSSTHLQEDIVVHKQHMVPSLSLRVLVSCWYAAIGRTILPIAAYQQDTRTLIESDGTICCLCTTMSSWRWVLDTRNM